MIADNKKNWAIEMLKEKADELERIPKKDDFDEVTRSRIKAYLGPWPRALETAGLKPPKEPRNTTEHRRKKRNKIITQEEN
ncbi:MAG: hypothetical protein NC215_06125 [Ruminococcus sp.]|nr:hypothetical protein [Ruminococcus sp.]MCM1392136.1 hypothetical protein [Ruminococcus sp.]